MKKIKSHLIIYHPSRYSISYKTCIKKRLSLSQLKYDPNKTILPYIKKLTKTQICKYIHQIDFTLSYLSPLQTSLPRLLSHFLLLNPKRTKINVSIPFKELSENQQKFFRRLVKQKKRLQYLKLDLLSVQPAPLNFLKTACRIRSLKDFNLTIIYSTIEKLNTLKTFLQYINQRKPWTSLQSQRITLEINDDLDHMQDINKHIVQCSKKLTDLNELFKLTHTELALLFKFAYRVFPETWRTLGNALQGLENVKYFEFSGSFKQEFACVLQGIQKLKTVERINFFFDRDFKPSLLQTLPSCLENIGGSLTNLWLNIFNLSCRSPCMIEFAKELGRLRNLRVLGVEGFNCVYLNDEFLLQLSRSIKLMKDLQELKFMFSGNHDPKIEISRKSIEEIFGTIGEFSKLQRLCLGFYGTDENKIYLRFESLCESLKKTKNLRVLDLSFTNMKIGDKEIAPLLMVLPELRQLEELSLPFVNCEKFENKTMVLLIKKMAQLKWLRKVNLDLKCSEIEREFVSLFGLAMNRLKCLESVSLMIWRIVPRVAEETRLYDISRGLCERIIFNEDIVQSD